MPKVKEIFSLIKNSFYPKTCLCCGEIIDENESICYYCNEMLERCNPLDRCIKCGLSKKNCHCNYNVFRFDGCVAPFINSGVAKNAMYAFKFRHREEIGDFFASYMALAVKNEYRDIVFDGICYVPMLFRKQLKRGSNQTIVLAEKIGKILNIPVYAKALKCVKSNKTQHELDLKKRFENVKDMYRSNYSVKGKTILLVDDIKTTGASLDACADELYKSGAARVYCVTALITEKKKK